jgi:spore coat protein X
VRKLSENNWRALDHCCDDSKADAMQGSTTQQAFESIVIKDSEGVTVTSTDNQAAISLQVAIQAAIAIVISISVGSPEVGKSVVQDLKQYFKSKQLINKKTIIHGSKAVTVTTTDNQVVVNIQALVQILLAIVAKLEIL